MSENEFEILAEAELQRILGALDEVSKDDFDADLQMGVLTIAFSNGSSSFVVNSHRAARQIWMAAGTTAWHFSSTDDGWIASKNQDELWSALEVKLSERLARPIQLPR